MDVFDCHVNRSPCKGKVSEILYKPGKFLNASLDKSSEENERNYYRITNSQGEAACNVDMNHCNRYSEIQLNNQLQDICFDNVRMVKGGDNSVEINNNFFQQQQGILDKCVDKVYDDNGELKPDNDLKA